MSTETLEAQAVGGPEAVGSRLAAARAAKGWSVEAAAAALKVPAHVVSSLEGGQWQRLGAPVFVRGQLRSYARQLGLEINTLLAQTEVEQWVPVNLVSHVRAPRLRRWTDGLGRWLAWAASASAIVVLAVLLLRHQWGGEAEVASLDDFSVQVAEEAAAVAEGLTPLSLPETGPGPAPVTEEATVPAAEAAVATGTPAQPAALPQPAPAAVADGQLQLEFSDQSWIEIHDRNGAVIERAMVSAGQTRSYPSNNLGRVLLGNSNRISARLNGAALDLAPLRRSNVARFTVSSDGSASPVAN